LYLLSFRRIAYENIIHVTNTASFYKINSTVSTIALYFVTHNANYPTD